MIDRQALLKDLKTLLPRLEADLRERAGEHGDAPDIHGMLTAEYEKARAAGRTAASFEEWRAEGITQKAAAWILSCVFARFLEDNGLVDPPRISGPGERLKRARDEHELYFRSHPTETDREYLLDVFAGLAALPAGGDVFGKHNGIHVFPGWLSGDAAGELLAFFQRIDAASGALIHDFTDGAWDTRFLGDLYQDLSETARKKYALLQTPDFVEAFILDRTLEPALDEFGLDAEAITTRTGMEIAPAGFRMIDPACGPGHFLLGGFERIYRQWADAEPAVNARVLVQRALDSVHGVDVNPFAVAIARFRLLLAALGKCGVRRLKDAPNFRINLACGDSLWHGRLDQMGLDGRIEVEHHYQIENIDDLRRILRDGRYHAVVANPPYITVKDKALNQAYRKRYPEVCHMKYSLAVPFMQRIFSLACENGFTGQITANSFMKREFGKKLVENYLPKIDLTHVIDAGGAYIPGHGTPTVILFGRNRKPVASNIRTVMGSAGEPATPDDPSRGKVWTAITRQIDQIGSQSEFVSVSDTPREQFGKHPWSLGGGGAAELKDALESFCGKSLREIADIGVGVVTLEDDAFQIPINCALRTNLNSEYLRGFIVGDLVRDWILNTCDVAIFPYSKKLELFADGKILNFLWPLKTSLSNRIWFRKTQTERGFNWFEYGHVSWEKFQTQFSIVFAFVATHNHFVLDRGGKVFNRSAPVIKLPSDATEDEHFALLGLLNSSVACFWMKQVFHNKGATSDKGILQASPEKFRYEFDGTKLKNFPIPEVSGENRERLLTITRALNYFGQQLSHFNFKGFLSHCLTTGQSLQSSINECISERDKIRSMMVRWQEELDWLCYELYGLIESSEDTRSLIYSYTPEEMPSLNADMRPYRLVQQNPISTAETQIDASRANLISKDPQLKLVEAPEYKRRWFRSAGAYDATNLDDRMLFERAVKSWLLDRLESYFDFDGRMNDENTPTARLDISLTTIARLSDIARTDDAFMEVAERYRQRPDFSVPALVADLVKAESVPLLPILRYKPAGLDKRAAWERTWELQRLEDAQQPVGDIPVPPKYTTKDFQNTTYWRLRGKLDVPKERWISFPLCEGEDASLPIAWAGYDHLQQAQAIAAHYVDIQEKTGGSQDPRLRILLACLVELLPWLKQWHNDIDPEYNQRMGDYYADFVNEEARLMDKTVDDIKDWRPPRNARKKRRKG